MLKVKEEKELNADQLARQNKNAHAKSLGGICAIAIQDGDVEKYLYLKKPHRKYVGIYYKAKEKDELEAAGNLLKACTILEVSDMDILSAERDDLWYSAVTEIDVLLNSIELKKSTSLTL